MPRLDQLPGFQKQLPGMAQEAVEQLKKGAFGKACFLYHYALEVNWSFTVLLQKLCDDNGVTVHGSLKTNLARIAQKIKRNKIDQEASFNPFRITDMSRATITVAEPRQMQQLYSAIDANEHFTIVRIKNHLDSHEENVTLNIII